MYKDRPFRFYLLLWALVILSVVAGLTAKPLYRRYKKHKALEIVAEINAKDFPAQDWDSVGRKIRLAHGYAPNEPEVLRVSARYLAIAGQPDSLQYYAMLIETGKATVGDRIDYARQSLRHNRPDIGRAQIRQVMVESPLNHEGLMVGIEILDRLGLTRDALQLAEAAFQSHPTSDEANFRLGWLQMRSGRKDLRERGRKLLWSLALAQGPFKGRAIERLTAERDMERAEILVLTKSLEAIPQRTLTDDFLWYDLRHRLASDDEKNGIVSLVIQRLGHQAAASERIQAADWLLTHGAPTRVTEVLDESLIRQNGAAAQRWIQARANAGNWAEVGGLIEDTSLTLSPNLRHCYRALMEFREGNTNAVISHLNDALTTLKDNPTEVMIVANYAERLRQPKLAAAAFEKLLANPLHAARAAQEMLRLLSPSDDVQHLLTTLRRLHQFQPDNEDVADTISWYELMTGQRVPQNAVATQERMSRHPKSDRFRLTAALAHLKQHNPDAALNLLEGQSLDQTNAPARGRLLYVAAVGATGQRQTAERLAQDLNPATYKPEEFELVRPWRETAR